MGVTLTELLALRENDPRAFHRLVAEKVMGWTLGEEEVGFAGGSEYTAERFWDGPGRTSHRYEENSFHPTTDPRADLEAHRVAAKWPDHHFSAYLEILSAIIRQRQAGGGMFPRDPRPSLWWLRHYVVGDYSTAALAVKEEG